MIKNMTEFVYSTINKHLGGEGSGYFGHAGRPGEVGGSSSEGEVGTAPAGHNKISPMKVPRYVYVGLDREWYEGWEGKKEPPVKDVGLKAGLAGQFKHSERWKSAVYVATNLGTAQAYARLNARPMVLKIDTAKLDRNEFYTDPLDFPLSSGQPQQLAYKGNIPMEAIEVQE